MGKTNRQYVFDALELLSGALKPFVTSRLESSFSTQWETKVRKRVPNVRRGELSWDISLLLRSITTFWEDVFKEVFGRVERSYVEEIRDIRNRLAHDKPFSTDDTDRALGTIKRLLESISAGEAAGKITEMRTSIIQRRLDDQRRNEERRRSNGGKRNTTGNSNLRSWRDVAVPHRDVASGQFKAADFAADLFMVHTGRSDVEYDDPREFFRRTYLTAGLAELLTKGAQRLSGEGGDPVIELQTNFGGGKTHSMLALYHMCGGTPASELFGLDQLASSSNMSLPKDIKRAVVVGTSRFPKDTLVTSDGCEINTLWGDLAWQIGGKSGYEQIEDTDKSGIPPGVERLSKLFSDYSPCLILIDEWIAYLRHIYNIANLPSGSFESNISFVQSLTEAVKASPKVFLVASLPESEVEAGGEGGIEALNCLQAIFSRINVRWTPATDEESYEIVRRRLFQDISPDMFQCRDDVIMQFAKLYRNNNDTFPKMSLDSRYKRKIEKSYPIHPELFDQLYYVWGNLEMFQKTRGLLRLMANIVHKLWMSSDPSAMIMPGSVYASEKSIQTELLKSIPKEWDSIIDGDIDGDDSIPFEVDRVKPHLGQISATQRVARSVFLATAPLEGSQNPYIDTKRIILGACQPEESPALFEDALRQLSQKAKYIHSSAEGTRYSRTPSLNREIEERASGIDDRIVAHEFDRALDKCVRDVRDKGPFHTIQVVPGSSADVPDEAEGIRLVVLGSTHSHDGKDDSPALREAKSIFLNKGKLPRIYQNTLVFLALSQYSLSGIQESICKRIAVKEIIDSDNPNFTKRDISFLNGKLNDAISSINGRIREGLCYAICPTKEAPSSDLSWNIFKVVSPDEIFSQISKKLISSECIYSEIGARRLHSALVNSVWNDEPHLLTSQVWEFCNKLPYLPRLCDKNVLRDSIGKAISGSDAGPFSYAERAGEDGNYERLLIQGCEPSTVVVDNQSVIVNAEIAGKFQPTKDKVDVEIDDENINDGGSGGVAPIDEAERQPKTFYGMVELSSERPAKDMGKILDEVVSHITGSPGGSVTLTLEIDGHVPDGIDKKKVRTLLENTLTLGFKERQVK